MDPKFTDNVAKVVLNKIQNQNLINAKILFFVLYLRNSDNVWQAVEYFILNCNNYLLKWSQDGGTGLQWDNKR